MDAQLDTRRVAASAPAEGIDREAIVSVGVVVDLRIVTEQLSALGKVVSRTERVLLRSSLPAPRERTDRRAIGRTALAVLRTTIARNQLGIPQRPATGHHPVIPGEITAPVGGGILVLQALPDGTDIGRAEGIVGRDLPAAVVKLADSLSRRGRANRILVPF